MISELIKEKELENIEYAEKVRDSKKYPNGLNATNGNGNMNYHTSINSTNSLDDS